MFNYFLHQRAEAETEREQDVWERKALFLFLIESVKLERIKQLHFCREKVLGEKRRKREARDSRELPAHFCLDSLGNSLLSSH